MILKNRILWSDNGVIKDISDALNNHVSGSKTIPFVAAEDYLYIGSDAPFNHRWMELSVLNDQASVMSVHIWSGSAWVAVAEVIDGTINSAGTISMSQSGRIAWVPDKNEPSWSRDDTYRSSGTYITGLTGLKIYDMYWARISFSGDLKATMNAAFMGFKFANDEDLQSLWPEFATTEAMNRFKTGLTTFDQVHFEAAKQVIRDMQSTKIIDSGNQVLEWEVLRVPAIHKAAEIIFTGYGSDWKDEMESARLKYKESMRVELFKVDLNKSATIDPYERNFRTGNLVR
jgi:hypothetical protein